MPKFIVFAGKKQSGKSTAAKYVSGCLPVAKVVSFADPIKEFCKKALGLTDTQINGSDEDKNSPTNVMWNNLPDDIRVRYGRRLSEFEISTWKSIFTTPCGVDHTIVPARGYMTAREVMQVFGTDMIRNYFGQDIWAEALFRNYRDVLNKFIIVDDCRFPNEADIALRHGATLIRLTRDVCAKDNHASETALDLYPIEKYTYVLDNSNLTIDETRKKLREILDAAAL